MLGMMRVNCIAIQFTVPECDYFMILSTLPKKDQVTAQKDLGTFLTILAKDLAENDSDEEEDEEEEDDEEDGEAEEEEEEGSSEEEERKSGSSGLRHNSGDDADFEDLANRIGAFEGTGLFPLISKLNHSCVPNASVDFSSNNTGVVTATREILPGEEICISYIEEEDERGFEERQTALVDYQFECDCPRCEKENPTKGKQKKRKAE